jgi:hypothetical protein
MDEAAQAELTGLADTAKKDEASQASKDAVNHDDGASANQDTSATILNIANTRIKNVQTHARNPVMIVGAVEEHRTSQHWDRA